MCVVGLASVRTPGAAPLSNRDNTNRLLVRPTTAQSWAISDAGGIFVITYLRKGKNTEQHLWERENPADTKAGGKKGGRRCTWLQRRVPQFHEPMEDHSVSDIHHAGHGQPHTRADGDPAKEAVTHGELKKKQTLGRTFQPVERSSHKSRFSGRICVLWGTYTGAVCSWRTARQWVRGGEKILWMKFSLRKWERCKEGDFTFVLMYNYPTLLLICNRINKFHQSQDYFTHDSKCWGISLSFSCPMRFFHLSPLAPLKRGNDRDVWFNFPNCYFCSCMNALKIEISLWNLQTLTEIRHIPSWISFH